MNIKIIGAGLAGLLAANVLRRYNPTVVEVAQALPHNHSALLRFRSQAVAVACAIPFTRVQVRKGIWDGNTVTTVPTPTLANRYSFAVTGEYGDRSVWNLDPEPRWIAPADLVEGMARGVNIKLSTPFSFIDHGRGSKDSPVISTLPMPALMRVLGYPERDSLTFGSRPIWTVRAQLRGPKVNLQQTIYNASGEGSWYRATIQENELIIEFYEDPVPVIMDMEEAVHDLLADVFGIQSVKVTHADLHTRSQSLGKITPIPEAERKAFIRWATVNFNIYSLGRFATWRPILLDDVVSDCQVIDRLITTNNHYDLALK